MTLGPPQLNPNPPLLLVETFFCEAGTERSSIGGNP
jgi:hypothetical protein